jgi:antitoxin component YwqK of YwqJK toxin-antitoxin module
MADYPEEQRRVASEDGGDLPETPPATVPPVACPEYDAEGRLTALYHRQGGSLEGPGTWYNEAGQVVQQACFKHGQLHGEMRRFDNNGRLVQRCHFAAGKLEGAAFFYSDGQLQACMAFRDGRRDGEYRLYDEQGQLREHSFYKDGARAGEATYYGANGQPVKRAAYWNNRLHGKTTYYHGHGMVREIADYRDNRLHGDVITYAPDGTIVVRQRFKDGKPVDEPRHATPLEPGQSKAGSTPPEPSWWQRLWSRLLLEGG